MREFSAAWKWTIDEKMGIFSAHLEASVTDNQRPPPVSVKQHMLLIQVRQVCPSDIVLDRSQITSYYIKHCRL